MKTTPALLLLVIAVTFAAACGNSSNTNRPADANTRAVSTTATPAAPAPAATADELADARNTYMQFCTRCHKPDGSGGPFEVDGGKKLDVPPLREGHALKHSDEEFAEQIMNGGDGMPAFKNRLDQERVNGLVRFIRREFQGKTSSGSASSSSSNVNKPMPAPAH